MASGRRIALLDLGDRPSTSGHALAAQLEHALSGVLVQVLQVPLRPSQGRAGELASRTFDRALERVLALEPELIALGSDLWNIDGVLAICQRTRTLAPGIEIVLGGPEAVARRAELEARPDVDRVLAGAAAPALVAHLHGPDPVRRGAARLRPELRYAQRVGELSSRGASPRSRIWNVEAEWSARLPLALVSQTGALGPELSVEGALRRIEPARRAGLPVRLAAPGLVARRARLQELLRALAQVPQQGRLELELPAGLLEMELAAMLCAAGVSAVELDLASLAEGDGREPPAQFRAAVDLLASRGVVLRGVLLRPALGRDHRGLRRLVDRSLRAGIEEIRTLRLLVPPASPLRARVEAERLRFAPRPPYEAIDHRDCGFDEALRGARLGVTLEQLAPALAGTGLLRALATGGSAAELIEGFGETLAARGSDPLEGTARPLLDRAFVDYLREHHRIDLTQEEGRTRLARAPFLSLRWLRDGRRLISDDTTGRNAHLGRHALALLDRFDSPQTSPAVCEQVISRLAHGGPEQRSRVRRELRRTLDKLVSMSFLVPAQEAIAAELDSDAEVPFTCLEEFDFHYRMLSDAVRMDAYRRAIEQAVVPGQHAIEVGTGTGILAVLAAQAGARVTAIERFSILGMARAVARQNGVADRIRLVRGRSDLVQLDEPGDLLISEIVGNRILNEGLLESTLDARRRLLKPGARLIPSRLTILAEVGRAERFEAIPAELSRISVAHGVDLAPLATWFRERVEVGQVVWELGGEGEDFVSFAEEVPVISVDLTSFEEAEFVREVRLDPHRGGRANAVVLAFRLELQPGIELSTSGRHNLHWSKPVFMLREPVSVEPGNPLSLRVSYETQGELDVSLSVAHQSGTKSSLDSSAASRASRSRSATTRRPPSGGSTTTRQSVPR